MAPMMMSQLPVFNNFLRWFKRDELIVDNLLFRLHHQVTTAILMFGLLFIFFENHLDGRAINCRGGDRYAASYCWIHGSGYVKDHLQGEATGCYIDQSKLGDNKDAPVTAYYLWLPFLLTFCIGFAKLPRTLWKGVLEGGLIRNILFQTEDHHAIVQNFLDLRGRYTAYQVWFGLCELLNMAMICVSMWTCDLLFNNKFWSYGSDVVNYLQDLKHIPMAAKLHDPMCEVFPTEVACYIKMGASTGGIDSNNYLCILSNNLFNQKYFLVLWMWWVLMLILSTIGLTYRLARLSMPGVSRALLVRRVRGWTLGSVELSGGECFVLDRLADNMPAVVLEMVLGEVARRLGRQQVEGCEAKDSLIRPDSEQAA